MSATIEELRKNIDRVDSQILELLQERANLAKTVGETKRRNAPATAATQEIKFFDPEREQRIIHRLEQYAIGAQSPFPTSAIPHVFKEIISACRSLEAPFRISYLGPPGTYTQIAAQRIFGQSVQLIEAPSIEGVFDAISRDQAEYGVVPIENSYEGGVVSTLDALLREEVFIRRQTVMKVNHCLVTRASETSRIQRLHSHPQAIGQCRLWIAKNLPGVEILPAKSTAAAARLAADDERSAAISSRLAAELLKMNVLREGIQDQTDNSTRFVVLARADGPNTGADQTSLAVSLKAKPSALMKALRIFDEEKVPVLRVESRAGSERLWQYMYFIDLKGHREDGRMVKALKRLAPLCERVKMLGSYPAE